DVRLTGIRQASTYACRSRNSQPDAKISEHAKGNAVDVATFSFEGHDPLSIKPDQRKGSREESFQMAVRAGACLHFTTVLGPGADAYHDDHLHLDLAKRRSGYRLCQ
ncbi:MAG: extensin family protein, partial [Oricola sp.]|nr:extensin family protein [Oricola sp.]